MSEVTFLDSTVLVAALVAAHPRHRACRAVLQEAGARPGAFRCSTHAVAETFRVLVALPLTPRLDAEGARLALQMGVMPRLDPVALSLKDYDRAMDAVCASGLGAGSIYDALHLAAAERLRAGTLLTDNRKHFERLAAASGSQVHIGAPPD